MNHTFLVILGIAILVLLIPPRWDPAIRIKEWQLKRWSKADKVHIFDARDGEM